MFSNLRPTVSGAALILTFSIISCSAPISYKSIKSPTPQSETTTSPLAEASRELAAGKAAKDSLTASSHFLKCARLTERKALIGEPNSLALYNHAVSRLVEQLGSSGNLPWGRAITVGNRTLRGKLEPGAPRGNREYVPADTLEFHGVYGGSHVTRPGIGAPLVAISEEDRDSHRNFENHRVHASLTAVLRFEGNSAATLELHNPLDEKRVSIGGHTPDLAADFSAPASLMMSIQRPDKLGLIRLLNPQKYSDTARLLRMQKYDKNRIPVLFVHGLQDTPASWAPMYFQLMNDPVIRDKYQFWVFSYPSGYPYPYSASLLRKELDGIGRTFPDHKKIVIIGHSMGGVISRLMVTDAGDRIFRRMFGRSPQDLKVPGASRQLLLDAYVFNHRPDISRAIFISAPHQGSEIASNWIGNISSRLVRMPTFLTDARNAVASVVTADVASIQLDRAPNSIDTLSPKNPFVREVNKLPIYSGIPYHSIMGDRGKGGNLDHTNPVSSDGVVPYWSSHLNGAVSEKIVPSGHSAHQNPQGMAEVNRILKLHLK